ncbi:MAG: hypothetical protein P4N41_21175 [Negativicutes bacterium]|nr:hypothetical protein [Negativicutes bacterium]
MAEVARGGREVALIVLRLTCSAGKSGTAMKLFACAYRDWPGAKSSFVRW